MPNRVVTMTRAPNVENLRSNFPAGFNEHFPARPETEIFELIYRHDPRLYFFSPLASNSARRHSRSNAVFLGDLMEEGGRAIQPLT
jgi:hypothetical protein